MVSEAPACRALLNEATKKWPGRDKSSDGVLSSDAHKKQNPNSDHDYGNAVDLTHDPANGCDAHALAKALADNPDPRVKYIISNRKIRSYAKRESGWRDYDGSNPHTKHAHFSIYSDSRHNTGSWLKVLDKASGSRSQEDTMAKLDKEDLNNIEEIIKKHIKTVLGNSVGPDQDGAHVSTADLLKEIRSLKK